MREDLLEKRGVAGGLWKEKCRLEVIGALAILEVAKRHFMLVFGVSRVIECPAEYGVSLRRGCYDILECANGWNR